MDAELRKQLRMLGLITAWIVGVLIIYALRSQLLIVVVAIFLAVCLNPAVSYFARHVTRGNRMWATILTYIAIALVVLFCILTLLPLFVHQGLDLIKSIPELYDKVAASDTILGKSLRQLDIHAFLADHRDDIVNALTSLGASAVDVLISMVGGVVQLVTLLSFAFLMVVHAPYWQKVARQFVSRRNQSDVEGLAGQMYTATTSYVNGNLFISSIAGTAATLMLLILQVPNALALGMIVAVVDLIPSIGATLAGIIVVTLTLLQTGWVDAAIMTAFILLYQQVENLTLQPMVYGHALKVPSLIILVGVFLFGSLFGFVGALLSIPFIACLHILLRFFMDKWHSPEPAAARVANKKRPKRSKK